MRNAVLIYNPFSGGAAERLLPRVLDELTGSFAVEPRPTAGPGDATRLAKAAVDEGVEVAFAMGGDGTLREVAAGLLGSGVALGPLPAGTANVLALALGLPRDAVAAARILPQCRPRTIDVALATVPLGGSRGGDSLEEPFLMMASCGLDSEVMARQSPVWKKRFGRAAFAVSFLKRWASYAYPEIAVRHDGTEVLGSLVAVCNIPLYGGAFRMAPDADPADGELDLVVFRGRGRAATLGFARDLARGRHVVRRDVEVARVRQVTIEAPPGVRLQIDGDVLEAAPPFTVRLAGEQLSVLLP